MENDVDYYRKVIERWIANEKKLSTGAEAAETYYLDHKKRIDHTFDLCVALKPDRNASVLDIGRHFLTYRLAGYYRNVATLGFDLDESMSNVEHGEFDAAHYKDLPHTVYDLNAAKSVETWPRGGRYDLIVYAETMEHLHEAPEFTLLMLEHMLKPDGLIICTTPNGAYFLKRMRCLMGRNAQERIRYFSLNPGHYREYTKDELEEMGRMAGLSVMMHEYIDYRHSGNMLKRALKTILGIIPSWRMYQIVIYRKAQQDAGTHTGA